MSNTKTKPGDTLEVKLESTPEKGEKTLSSTQQVKKEELDTAEAEVKAEASAPQRII